jgi:drug/metabolite transporter (DMT)-like permease
VDPAGAAALTGAAAAWAVGTLYYRGPRKPASALWAAGAPLVLGGMMLVPASAAAGELGRVRAADVTAGAVLAMAYLIVFGSVVAFTAYSWLVEVEGPSRTLSAAYVNPLVAVLLGAVAGDGRLTARTVVAAGAIVAAVVLIITGTRERTASPENTPTTEGGDDDRTGVARGDPGGGRGGVRGVPGAHRRGRRARHARQPRRAGDAGGAR